jgi:hypothetical protein
MTKARVFLLALVLAGVAASVACHSPTSSTPPATTAPAVARSLTITGPLTVGPDQTVAFGAVEHFSDGSTLDVTTQAQWQSAALDTLTVSTTGAVTGHQSGEAALTARLGTFSATADVLVLPAGTFRLTGTVTEVGLPVSNVVVTVTSGVGVGLFAQTDGGGQYRLYGVSGPIQLRATKSGFTDAVDSLTVSANATEHVTLTPVNPEPDISGVYGMTIEADPACQAFPSDDRVRHYVATITETSLLFRVALSGATFVTANGFGNSFSGQIQGGQINFVLEDSYYGLPDLVESLSDGEILVLIGSGVLAPSGSDLVATFPGTLTVFASQPPYFSRVAAQCTSQKLRMVLTPQAMAARRIKR